MSPAAVTSLPEGYRKTGEFDIKKDMRLLVKLNVAGFGLFVLAIILLTIYNNFFHPSGGAAGFEFSSVGAVLGGIGLLLLDVGLMLVLHEAVHGIFFWLFTSRPPKVGIGMGYAFAAAPGWYLPRGRYLVIGLGPVVLLTLTGLALVPFASGDFLFLLNTFIVRNFSGAVGDLWVVGWLLRRSPAALIQDFGDRIEVYESV
jgi:hypothetical protein